MTHSQRISFVLCLSLLVGVRFDVVTMAVAANDEQAVDADESEVRQEVGKLVEELDSDNFADRKAAALRLKLLVAQPALGTILAGEFERTLL